MSEYNFIVMLLQAVLLTFNCSIFYCIQRANRRSEFLSKELRSAIISAKEMMKHEGLEEFREWLDVKISEGS